MGAGGMSRILLAVVLVFGAGVLFVGHYHNSDVKRTKQRPPVIADPTHGNSNVLDQQLQKVQHAGQEIASALHRRIEVQAHGGAVPVIHSPTAQPHPVGPAFLLEQNPKKVPWLPSVTNQANGSLTSEAPDGHTFGWVEHSHADPRVLILKNVLTKEERDDIISLASKELQRSMVISSKLDGSSEQNQVRTSSGMFMVSEKQRNSHANRALRKRVQTALGLRDDSWIEATQILRYEGGQFYRAHADYFSPGDAANMNRGGQRIATVLTWLNDVHGGGETSFPLASPAGFRVKPSAGDAVLFYNVNEDGVENMQSNHGGNPPAKGEVKWVAVTWCHGRTFV